MKNLLVLAFISWVIFSSCKEQTTTPEPPIQPEWEEVVDLPGDYLYLNTKGNTIYMVCYNEDYKFAVSSDSGKNWQVNELGFLPKYGTGFLSVEGNKFFIAGEDGLFESADSGKTWNENLALRNYINPNDPLLRIPTLTSLEVVENELFLGQVFPNGCGHGAHVKGLFYSSDNGMSWICPSSLGTPYRVTAIHKINNTILLSNFKMYYSEDGFNSWQVASGLTDDVAEFFRDNSRVYAVHYGFIKYSDDQGRHWIDCTPSEINDGLGIISTFTMSENRLFIIDNDAVVHFTEKSLLDWKTMDTELPAFDPFPYDNQAMFTLGNDYLYYISNDKLWRKKITD